jgi:hypothetical protein
MQVRWWIILGLGTAAGWGCRRDEAPGAPAKVVGRIDAAWGVVVEPERAADAGAPPAPPVGPSRFQWTRTPTPAGIPAAPVSGEVHGKPFPVAQVVFEPSRRGWTVLLLERPLPEPTAAVSQMRFLRVDLPAEPAVGQLQQRALAPGGALFQVELPDDPASYTLWTADNAWVLELSEWDVRPWDPAGPAIQVAGRAAGRIAVCYEGGGDFRNAWVAGSFAEALVRYTGEPRFEPDRCGPRPGGGE